GIGGPGEATARRNWKKHRSGKKGEEKSIYLRKRTQTVPNARAWGQLSYWHDSVAVFEIDNNRFWLQRKCHPVGQRFTIASRISGKRRVAAQRHKKPQQYPNPSAKCQLR